MEKDVLITGIGGQDGSYLAELLLEKGYEVHGIVRRSSTPNLSRLAGIEKHPRLHLYHGDLQDAGSIRKLINEIEPNAVINLAAQSQVQISFDQPEYTADIDGVGVIRILDAIKDFQAKTGKNIRFYQASSSEMFGSSPPPQNEKTPFKPRSPYACAKVLGYYATVNYREAHDLFAVNGILFNHESPRRPEEFVTRTITLGIAKIIKGKEKCIYLGNLDARRDWGYAPEYAAMMWKMLQQKKAEDYVIGTGQTHSIREFLAEAFEYAGLGDYNKYVKVDKRYVRPLDVNDLRADASKAERLLGWKPRVKFKELVRIMVDADVKAEGVEHVGR